MIDLNKQIYIDSSMKVIKLDENNSDIFMAVFPKINRWIIVDKNTVNILELLCNNMPIHNILEKLQNENLDIEYNDLCDSVHDLLNYLYENDIISNRELPLIYEENVQVKPNSIYIEITTDCNLRCAHCFGMFGDVEKIELPYKKIMDIIEEAYNLNVKNIILSGGEPVLHKDFIKICKKILSCKLNLVIATNGTIINDELLDLLEQYENISIQVSLEGVDTNTHDALRGCGTFNRTIKNIEELCKRGFNSRISISTTIFKDNCNKIKDILDWCLSKNISKIAFKKMINSGRASANCNNINIQNGYEFFIKELSEITKKYKDIIKIDGSPNENSFKLDNIININYPCTLGENVKIDANGNVFPCQLLSDAQFSIGNIFTENLNDVYKGDKLKNIIDISKERINKIKKCNSCTFLHFCWGGCMAQSYNEYGTLYKEYPYCEYRKNVLKNKLEEDICVSE